MESKYNVRNPSVKRLMREAQELHEPTEDYYAQPLDDNLFEWHFTVRGPDDSAFEGGVYHGRILLPSQYPMKPPSIIMMTPNGRFEVNKKICLSISGHHPESWRPSWSIRTALMAIIGFLPTPAAGAIASLEYNDDERRRLAAGSRSWSCPQCGEARLLLAAPGPDRNGHDQRQAEARELAGEFSFQGEKAKGASGDPTAPATSSSPAAATGDAPAAPAPADANTDQPAAQPAERLPQPPEVTLAAAEEPSWASSTLIVVLVAAIAALLCRRLFLLDAERLDGLSESM
ncbi:ubiquitin-conjugating enzyme E2 J1-like [Amphibalanus amphitrite]|uniref:ubiquitin-conjugating enzyme E2 J1-like n=1 Tax=Amphibalanus amphitrite TaxID=1232801 RepID=UPI001C91F254|nr:ubiquitin-conjugating enzyme E2 J1-like [Amphibalanus amphitrite]